MPVCRAISISGLFSALKHAKPSTSAGAIPASSSAATTASQARLSSLRPESLENSVAPMPTMAAWPPSSLRRLMRHPRAGAASTVPVTWLPIELAPTTATSTVPPPPAGSSTLRVTVPVRVIVSPG